jgi:hypothetical protein
MLTGFLATRPAQSQSCEIDSPSTVQMFPTLQGAPSEAFQF